jgi:hypothetical protein
MTLIGTRTIDGLIVLSISRRLGTVLMVRSAAKLRVSNHEFAAILRDARQSALLQR